MLERVAAGRAETMRLYGPQAEEERKFATAPAKEEGAFDPGAAPGSTDSKATVAAAKQEGFSPEQQAGFVKGALKEEAGDKSVPQGAPAARAEHAGREWFRAGAIAPTISNVEDVTKLRETRAPTQRQIDLQADRAARAAKAENTIAGRVANAEKLAAAMANRKAKAEEAAKPITPDVLDNRPSNIAALSKLFKENGLAVSVTRKKDGFVLTWQGGLEQHGVDTYALSDMTNGEWLQIAREFNSRAAEAQTRAEETANEREASLKRAKAAKPKAEAKKPSSRAITGDTQAERALSTFYIMIKDKPPSKNMQDILDRVDASEALQQDVISGALVRGIPDGDILTMGHPRWLYEHGYLDMHADDNSNRWALLNDKGRARLAELKNKGKLAALPHEGALTRLATEDTREAEFEKFSAELERLGLKKHIGLRILDAVEQAQENWKEGQRGEYDTYKRLISLAMGQDRTGFDHEMVHALESLGLLRPEDLVVMDRAIKWDKAINRFVDTRYAHLTEDERQNEKRAELYAKWVQKHTAPPGAHSALRFLDKMFAAIKRWFARSNYEKLDDLFDDIRDGVVGRRDIRGSTLAMQGVLAAKKAASSKATRDAKALEKLRDSRTAEERNRSTWDMFATTRDSKQATNLLGALWKSFSNKTRRLALTTLTTDDITRWVGDKITNLREINQQVENLHIARHEHLREAAEKVAGWEEYNKTQKDSGQKLSDAMHLSTLLNVDPSFKGRTRAEALKLDALIAEAQGLGKSTKARETQINTMYDAWEDLDDAGKDIYRTALKSYQDKFNTYMRLLTEKVTASPLPADAKAKMMAEVTRMFQEARKIGVYFPLMRYGKYWLRLGTGNNSKFFMFESETQQRLAVAEEIDRLRAAGDTRSIKELYDEQAIEIGHGVSGVRQQVTSSSKVLTEVFGMLDKANSADAQAVQSIKDQIYNLYLMTLPEMDLRTRYLPRKGRAGFSGDALRNFVVSMHRSANQLSRLEYADKIRNAVGASFAELKGRPDASDLAEFVNEVSLRASAEISPDMHDGDGINWDAVAGMANKATFLWMLTAPKSAIIQLTQLPMVGMPVLAARYGVSKTMAVAANYSFLLNKISTTKKASNGEIITEWGEPSVRWSDYVTKHKDKKRGEMLAYVWDEAFKRDMLMSTYAGDMSGRGRQSSASRGTPLSAVTRGVYNFMTGGFHHMERMTREIMLMSSAELAYDAAIKRGVPHEAAKELAAKEARKLTYDALFNYTQYNKPRLFKSVPGKVAFQFMTYPAQMVSYLARNFFNMTKGLTPADKKEAAIKFFGTLGMTFMFAGATGMPMYSMLMGVAEAVRDAMRPPEDDDDAWDYDEDDAGNPLGKRSLNLWFREQFLPQYFGPESSFAKAMGLTEEQAQMLQRGIEMGPLSAFTDLNFSASTGLDGLFFKNDTQTKTHKEALLNTMLMAFGPAGSLASSAASAWDDFENGQGQRGLEKILPAAFRGAATSFRLASEGNLTRDGAEIRDAEYYTTFKLLAQTIGFAGTEVAEVQKANILAKQIVVDIQAEKTKVLERVDRAMQQMDRSPTEHNQRVLDRVMSEIDAYNVKNYVLPITGDTLRSSLQGRAETRANAISGLVVEDRMIPLLDAMMTHKR
jgi:hypothetical protein